jgi:hypothetical protein
VYVTDHSPKTPKFATINSKDDEQFFRYKQSLEEYNSQPAPSHIESKKERYERGSLL